MVKMSGEGLEKVSGESGGLGASENLRIWGLLRRLQVSQPVVYATLYKFTAFSISK